MNMPRTICFVRYNSIDASLTNLTGNIESHEGQSSLLLHLCNDGNGTVRDERNSVARRAVCSDSGKKAAYKVL